MQNIKNKTQKRNPNTKMNEARFHIEYVKSEIDKAIELAMQNRTLLKQLHKIKNLL